jgi:hypothetical protein
MTNDQESHLNMQLVTAKYCDDNSSAVSSVPGYSSNLQTLFESNQQIQDIAGFQGTGTGGITSNKKQLRLNINASGADTARKLTSFAKLTDNYTLLGEVNFSESDFKNFSDIEARDKAQVLYNKAQEHLPEVPVYGITEATQTILQNNIGAFSAVIVAPRMGITNKSQATKQLAILFKTSATALEKMDAAVEIVRLTEPVFYDGYKSARKVIRKGTTKLAVKGLVTETGNGEPIKGVTVTFTLNDNTAHLNAASSEGEAELTKITAAKGGFNIKSLAAGVYKASFKKMGYAEQTVTVNVNDGELTTVEVALVKNEG